jgi:hypothetical protein
VNFCPICGTARVGNFCGGCGYRLDAETVTTESPMTSGLATSTRAVNVPDVTESKRAADSSAADVIGLPPGIIHGPAYVPMSNCFNCGKPTNDASRCEECGTQ